MSGVLVNPYWYGSAFYPNAGGTLTLTSGSSTVLTPVQELGFTAGSTWKFRFSVIFSDFDNNSYWLASISNSDGADQVVQNEFSCMWKKSAGVDTFGIHSSQGAQPYLSNPVDSQTATYDTTSKYYFEIIRGGSTTGTVNYYGTDSSYGSIVSTSTNASTSNSTGLDRIKFFSGTSTNNAGSVTISDVYFWDNET